MSEWISVEDRYPKVGQTVVWYHPPMRDRHGRNSHVAYYRADRFDLPHRPATHWMPLPEPPQ